MRPLASTQRLHKLTIKKNNSDEQSIATSLTKIRGVGVSIDEPFDRFIMSMRKSMDQYYAERTGVTTADSLRRKRQLGLRYTRIPPFGYRFKKNKFIVDHEEQRAIALIRDAKALGLSIRQTIPYVRACGYRGRLSRSVIHKTIRPSG
jgi:DNA invertase Pin-like site-specific DNA recombinase